VNKKYEVIMATAIKAAQATTTNTIAGQGISIPGTQKKIETSPGIKNVSPVLAAPPEKQKGLLKEKVIVISNALPNKQPVLKEERQDRWKATASKILLALFVGGAIFQISNIIKDRHYSGMVDQHLKEQNCPEALSIAPWISSSSVKDASLCRIFKGCQNELQSAFKALELHSEQKCFFPKSHDAGKQESSNEILEKLALTALDNRNQTRAGEIMDWLLDHGSQNSLSEGFIEAYTKKMVKSLERK
jgi:hypothetical protein